MVAFVKVPVAVTCPNCQKTKMLLVDPSGYQSWKGGELIQSAMPELSAADRESLISGVCDPCWDILFPETSSENENE